MAEPTRAAQDGFGMNAALWNKINSKMDDQTAANILNWAYQVTGQSADNMDFQSALSDGFLVCKLVLQINPQAQAMANISKRWKPKHTRLPFPAREQIQHFGNMCRAIGMRETDCFTAQDLYNGENLNNVCNCLLALNALSQDNSKCPGFTGPYIEGSFKHAVENRRQFTQQQLNESKKIVPKIMQTIQMDAGVQQDSYGVVKTAGFENYTASNEQSIWQKGSIKHESKPGIDGYGVVMNAEVSNYKHSNEPRAWQQGANPNSNAGYNDNPRRL